MLTSELIERKRDGETLSPYELRELFGGYLAGDVEEYQMAAFLMAVYFRGLDRSELEALTRIIIASGTRLDLLEEGAPPPVDKHSTGGVGDKVSLVLAPLVAEAGLRVPMVSGRGLGHTGGTLDKLESIPGFRTDLDLRDFRRTLDRVGCAMIGQTPEIAPLDGRLYALRDVTGTVPSIPLIASSIVSKKVAEGIEALVLDVKCGAGGFMQRLPDAEDLARTMVGLAAAEGVRATALVTAMDEPLGRAVGNALEVREAIECLHGRGPADLRELTVSLSVELLRESGLEADPAAARATLESLLDSGRAAERFVRLIDAQGGDPRVVERPERLPLAPYRERWRAPRGGTVTRVDARGVGLTAVELGAGRRRVTDEVDPGVGLEVDLRVGDEVAADDPLVTIHARDEAAARRACARLDTAVRIEEGPAPGRKPLILSRITGAESAARVPAGSRPRA